MPKAEVLQGSVKKVISQKEDWVCFTLNCDLFLEVTVTSVTTLTISKDQEIRVYGKFIEHPKWGQQFKASKIELLNFKTKHAAQEFTVFLFPALEQSAIDKLILKYGKNILDKLEEDLDTLNFLTVAQKNYIRTRFSTYKEEKKALSFLFDLDLSPILCNLAISILGSDLIQKVKENPYCLAEIDDFPFFEVDRIALKFKDIVNSEIRDQAAILHILSDIAPLRGHLFLTLSELFSEIVFFNQKTKPISDEKEKVFRALKQLRDSNKIIVETKRIYAKRWFSYEEKSARLLSKFSGKVKIKTDIEKFIREYEVRFNIQFSREQEQAVKALGRSKTFIITGYPGTGKTFVTKVLVNLLKKENLSYVLLTPTGISAKKLSLMTGEEAGTIHRKLGYTGKFKSWKFNSQQQFAVDVVIVDESSMIDQEVFYRMLEAIPPTSILIFIGDVAQLPSVGPGNVLRDLINSNCFEVISFTRIYRQSEGSSIKVNAKKIHQGQMVDILEKSHFYFIQETEHARILQIILKLSEKFKTQDIQVLSPKKASLIGTFSLNRSLKDTLNPIEHSEYEIKKEEINLGRGLVFRLNDKIMVTRNDYDREIYNGDCGRILKIDHQQKEIHFDIEGSNEVYVYSFGEAKARLQLAFAITIHKSQGLEYDVVIFPYTLTFHNQLHRNLLYTAVTRASKRVFIIGDVRAIQKAINTNKIIKRNTFLSERIKQFYAKT